MWGNLASALLYDGQRAQAMDAFRKQLELLKQQLQVNPQDAEGKAMSPHVMRFWATEKMLLPICRDPSS